MAAFHLTIARSSRIPHPHKRPPDVLVAKPRSVLRSSHPSFGAPLSRVAHRPLRAGSTLHLFDAINFPKGRAHVRGM